MPMVLSGATSSFPTVLCSHVFSRIHTSTYDDRNCDGKQTRAYRRMIWSLPVGTTYIGVGLE